MKIKTREIRASDIAELEKFGYSNTENQKRQARQPILEATDKANINVMVEMLIVLADLFPENPELDLLKGKLLSTKDYKQGLKDLKTEDIANIPKEIEYFVANSRGENYENRD